MFNPGLNHNGMRLLLDTLASTHERRITLEVQTLEGKTLSSLSPRWLSGTVSFDVNATPMRLADLRVFDPSRSISFDPHTPGGGFFRNRQLQVGYSVLVPSLGWVEIPVFTGPVMDFDRTGAEVTIVAHGREVQAMGAVWRPHTYPRKRKRTFVIKDALSAVGETRFDIPDLPFTTPERVTFGHLEPTWPTVQRLAASMDRVLFCDGRARYVLRRAPKSPVMAPYGHDIDERWLCSEIRVGRMGGDLKNTFEVKGPNPKGPKKRAHAALALSGQASPAAMGAGSGELHLVRSEEFKHVKTKREALKIARRWRDEARSTSADVEFEMLPNPLLEEFDLVRVKGGGTSVKVRMKRWTLPLDLDGSPMTVGTTAGQMLVGR